MANSPAGLFVVLAYIGITLLSIPFSMIAFLVAARRRTFGSALRQVGAVFGVVLVALMLATAVFVSPVGALWLAVATIAELLVLVAFPLAIGRQLVARWTGCRPDEALEFTTLGLPGALVASLVIFVSPGGASRYNVLFLDGPLLIAALAALVLVISVGPAVFGYVLFRVFVSME